MKLYTEEQVKIAMLEYTSYSKPTMLQVIDTLTPIELPSDEEIDKNGYHEEDYNNIWKEGAKWMRQQILNQNK